MDINPGDIVYSKAGRDKDKPFVVISVVDEQYVLLADGDLRKINAPKKKKLKHLKITGQSAELMKSNLLGDVGVTNAELKKALLEFVRDTDI